MGKYTKMSKDDALKIVEDDGYSIMYLPLEFQKDNDVILTALKQSLFSIVNICREDLTHNILAYLFDNQYQEYYDDILDIIYNTDNKNILQNYDYNLKNNKKLIEILCVIKSKTIKHASEEILNDKVFFLDIFKKYCGKYYNILKYLSPKLRDDEEIVKTLVSARTYTFEFKYASDRLKNDYNFILETVKINGCILEYVSKKFRCNREIVFEAVKNDSYALQFASKKLKGNREIVLIAIEKKVCVFKYVSNKLKSDKEIVLKVVKKEGMYLTYASKKLQDDEDVVLNAVKNDGNALEIASDRLKKNKKIVLKAIKQDKNYLLYLINNELNDDQKFISNAVKYNYKNFVDASDRLKKNKKFILYLLKINPRIIQYISEELQIEILLEIDINNNNNYIFAYISKNLLDNKEIMLQFFQKHYHVFNYMSNRLKNDEDLLFIMIKYKPEILAKPYFKNKFDNKFIFEILKLDLFSYVPDNIKKQFKNIEKVFNNKETDIYKLFDIVFKNIDNFIDNNNLINKIFKEHLDKFITIWYKSKSIRNLFIRFIEKR